MKNEFERKLKQQLEAAFNCVGATMMPDAKAVQLLAFAFVLGGGYEPVTLHPGLHDDLLLAAERFNIAGGQTPDADCLLPLKKRIEELEQTRWATPWVAPLLEQYGLRAPTK